MESKKPTKNKEALLPTLLTTLRVRESLLMTGFPFIGTLLSLEGGRQASLPHLFGLVAGTVLLSLAVYSFNSWGGIVHDRLNHRMRDHPLITGAISPATVLGLSLGCFAASTALFFFTVSNGTAMLGILIYPLWIVYSHPRLLAKGIPVLSSVIHMVGGNLMFMLGYTWDGRLDRLGATASIYFSLLFVAGHLNHEVKDYEADQRAGINTNAVRFGREETMMASFAVFAFSYALIPVAMILKIVDPLITLPFVLMMVPHTILYLRTKWAPTQEVIVKYQNDYRLLFLIAGVVSITIYMFQALYFTSIQ